MSGNVVYAVESGKRLSVGAPSCLAMPNGKVLVAFEVGGADAKGLAGRKGHESGNRWVQSKVFRGGAGGWSQSATVPVRSPRLFRDGGDVYLLGTLDGTLQICRSPDGGVSWSEPTGLSGGEKAGALVGEVREVGGKICALVWGGPASGWTVWGAPKGAGLANRKAWTRGRGTGPFEAWAAFGAARGAGVPAGGVAAKWRPSCVLTEAAEGHPWRAAGGGGEAWAFFATGSGRENWATALRLDAERLAWRSMGEAGGGEWGWLPFPGGHAPMAGTGGFGGGGRLRVAGHPGRTGGAPAWGREALEEEGWKELALWESADGTTFARIGTVARGEGEGSCGVVRDPSLSEAGGKTWAAWREGGAESRSARDMRQIGAAELGG